MEFSGAPSLSETFTLKTISGDINLSSPRIHVTSPFICLSHGISLEIISHVGLPATYDALGHCEKLR